jgi:hypothetical protein
MDTGQDTEPRGFVIGEDMTNYRRQALAAITQAEPTKLLDWLAGEERKHAEPGAQANLLSPRFPG